MPVSKIYLLSPKELSPETIAVAFAKTSRSPESFREIADGLTEESSAKFNEKWVVGYGHASVAEHAVLHIAMENVSRLAVECIESNRLASYTEKSTRYQKWDPESFITPPELENQKIQKDYQATCKVLFNTYLQLLEPVKKIVEAKNPRRENEPGDAYDRRIRSQYIDSCRFLLPAASLANVGMTANARVLEYAIIKMLSHPLQEVQHIGEEVKKVSQAEVPTLVKYAEKSAFMQNAPKAFDPSLEQTLQTTISGDWCQLIDFDTEAEEKILAALIYRFGSGDFLKELEGVKSLSHEKRVALVSSLIGAMGDHDRPLREYEHTLYTFDLILDQGAFAEFKRHRMMTQTPQMLTTRLGYAIPRLVVESGLLGQYKTAMEMAGDTFEKIHAWNPDVASYIVPNGYNRRVLFSMNLREAFAFCRLRTAKNAHFSIRRVASRVALEIKKVHPLLARSLVSDDSSWQEIDKEYLI